MTSESPQRCTGSKLENYVIYCVHFLQNRSDSSSSFAVSNSTKREQLSKHLFEYVRQQSDLIWGFCADIRSEKEKGEKRKRRAKNRTRATSGGVGQKTFPQTRQGFQHQGWAGTLLTTGVAPCAGKYATVVRKHDCIASDPPFRLSAQPSH